MFTSSVGPANAYIYTPQPYGATQNQFRYRPVGSTDWAYTDISTLYYRYLSNLTAGTQYEFQTRHECSNGDWSSYTASVNFTTTGGMANNSLTRPELPKPLTVKDLVKFNPVAYGIGSIPQVTLFPNPTSNQLFLKMDASFEKGDQLKVIDRIGRVIKEMTLSEGCPSEEIH